MGTVTSDLLAYGPSSLGGDTMSLAIKSSDGSGVALKADNLNGSIDLDRRKGRFLANDTVVTVELTRKSLRVLDERVRLGHPDAGRIDFGNEPGQLGSFVSTDPRATVSTFVPPTARYELNAASLEVGGVPVVASADALIYPEGGRLSIGKDGEMAQLVNARILADSVTKYHVIDSATVQIFGRKDYKARVTTATTSRAARNAYASPRSSVSGSGKGRGPRKTP